MDDQNRSNIKNMCEEFVNASQGNLSWEWEDRFQTVLTVFNVINKESILSILQQYLMNTWDSSTINSSDDDTQQIVNKFNGLKNGQLLFTTDTTQDDFLFALWWPWGNGDNISIRIAPSFVKLSQPDYQELIKEFKGWFNI